MGRLSPCSFAKEDRMRRILGSYIEDCLDARANVAAASKITSQRSCELSGTSAEMGDRIKVCSGKQSA